ncbi:MAG: phytanoyl-CoA dioxygenase family protein [Pirellulales bacterium]
MSQSKAVTVWLVVDDADPENACMKFIAGSHHHGHMTFRPSDLSEHIVLNQTIDNAEQYGHVVWDPLKADKSPFTATCCSMVPKRITRNVADAD